MVATTAPGMAKTSSGPRRGLFAIGLAMALVAFLVVFAVGLALASHGSTSVQRFQILVAVRDIQAREQLTPDMVAVQSYEAAALPAGALRSVADVKNMAAQVAILKGQPVTSNLIAGSSDPIGNGATGYLPIPQGFVGVTIPTSEQQGVAGYIAAGDYINVLATAPTSIFGANPPKTVTKTVFTNLHVIRVGPAPASAASGAPQQQGVASSLTVVVTECDAQYLNWLITNASIKYVLLSYHDYQPSAVTPDPACPATTPPAGIGATQVDGRYGFTRI